MSHGHNKHSAPSNHRDMIVIYDQNRSGDTRVPGYPGTRVRHSLRSSAVLSERRGTYLGRRTSPSLNDVRVTPEFREPQLAIPCRSLYTTTNCTVTATVYLVPGVTIGHGAAHKSSTPARAPSLLGVQKCWSPGTLEGPYSSLQSRGPAGGSIVCTYPGLGYNTASGYPGRHTRGPGMHRDTDTVKFPNKPNGGLSLSFKP
eukprot:779209-Rhodomonas_salina.1